MPLENISKEVHCPNCLKPAYMIGNEITCENCDAIFEVKQKQPAKVKQVGPIEDLRNRVERLESLIPGDEPETKDETKDKDEDDSLI